MLKKHDIIELEIDSIDFPDYGTGLYGEETVRVKNTLPGQKLAARITKVKKHIDAKLLEIKSASPLEIEPLCGAFPDCGEIGRAHV